MNEKGAPYHRLLARQMQRAGLEASRIEADPTLADLLGRVSRAYDDHDQERYLNERSNALASEEVRALHSDINIRAGRRAAVLNALSEGLLTLDTDGSIIDVNPAACFLMSLEESALVGRPIEAVLGSLDVPSLPSGDAIAWIGQAVRGGASWDVDRARLTTSSGRRDLAVAVTPISTDGDHGGSIVVLRDLTDTVAAEARRATLETQLRSGQKLQAVGQLASGVAHDFNNLLATIVSLADLLADQVWEEGRDDLAELRDAALRGATLTRQLLDFAHKQARVPQQPESVDVAARLALAAQRLPKQLGAGTEVRVARPVGVGSVVADEAGFDQIILNLALNASEAMDGAGGVLGIRAEAMSLGDRAGVALIVRDNGRGMDTETARRAFEPFFTTKEPGRATGLGLSSVYALVNGYQGRVSLRSEPGRGTQVTVWLPAAAPPAARAAEASPSEPAAAPERPTILVVDDEDGVRIGTRRLLERAGYQVIDAASAIDAMNRHQNARFDVLLTDMMMPGGKSGRDLADALRDRRPGLPVVYMSGYSPDAIDNQGWIEPGVPLLEKPFTRDQLLIVLDGVLTNGG